MVLFEIVLDFIADTTDLESTIDEGLSVMQDAGELFLDVIEVILEGNSIKYRICFF